MKNIGYDVGKRIFDIVAALCASIVFLIPWLVISIVIKIQSPGPAVYKARRVGRGGKVFTLYKFRSMCVDSGDIHATTLRNDPRVFGFGEFLRKSKLDETLQLVNILLGDMTVIGPRPEDEQNSEKFYRGKYKQILSVKPGLSSPASLYDYTYGEKYDNEEDYVNQFIPEKLDLEMYYIKNKSFLYDIEIIFRTIITIFRCMTGKENFNPPRELILLYKENTHGKQEIKSDSVYARR